MAADNKLELLIQVDAAGANASIKSVNKSFSGLEKEAVPSAKGASKGIDGMTLSMPKAVAERRRSDQAIEFALHSRSGCACPMDVQVPRGVHPERSRMGSG
ncbi:MAG: hypothetical protein HY651_10440 [Acidobacteria bacterium]|nr:hypothetical protein [Acidobacteriota bacterium]